MSYNLIRMIKGSFFGGDSQIFTRKPDKKLLSRIRFIVMISITLNLMRMSSC